MSFSLKKLFFTFAFNTSLFLLLMIGIQNSSNKIKINLFTSETIELPISFIVGISFITGSISGTILNINLRSDND